MSEDLSHESIKKTIKAPELFTNDQDNVTEPYTAYGIRIKDYYDQHLKDSQANGANLFEPSDQNAENMVAQFDLKALSSQVEMFANNETKLTPQMEEFFSRNHFPKDLQDKLISKLKTMAGHVIDGHFQENGDLNNHSSLFQKLKRPRRS